jgi:tyrosyl-tRNA synthetase
LSEIKYNVYDVLKERGFIEQCTDPDKVRELLGKERVTFYIGFDATADSLTAGHFLTVMAMMHMQKAGHRPIALMGGGTTMVGDPSFKTDARPMMTKEMIDSNVERFKEQLSRYIDFSGDNAILANNADWLLDINYVQFLREIGIHFSVNRMLTAECYKNRMEKGLTFFEFNYMLMQSYDFLELYRRYGATLEMGGNDQWSNMMHGADLIRRKDRERAFACTFQLLLTHDGRKMGKTEAGALWLDANKCSPYKFYQYWRNVDDQDVKKCLALLTFLPMDEVRRLGALEGAEINEAKKVLAYEVTKLVHGEEEAKKAAAAALSLFAGGGSGEGVPTFELTAEQLQMDGRVTTILADCGLCKSRSDARQQVQAGAVLLGEEKVTDVNAVIDASMFGADGLMLRKGKKGYMRLVLR